MKKFFTGCTVTVLGVLIAGSAAYADVKGYAQIGASTTNGPWQTPIYGYVFDSGSKPNLNIIGVAGYSDTGIGIYGGSVRGYGLRAHSAYGFGIYATSVTTDAINASTTNGNGLYAISDAGNGVVGISNSGIGVSGKSTFTAVSGVSVAGSGGVFQTANSSGMPALLVTSTDASNPTAATFNGKVLVNGPLLAQKNGGNVPHSCYNKSVSGNATLLGVPVYLQVCAPGEIAISTGGACWTGSLGGVFSVGSGQAGILCTQASQITVSATCCQI